MNNKKIIRNQDLDQQTKIKRIQNQGNEKIAQPMNKIDSRLNNQERCQVRRHFNK